MICRYAEYKDFRNIGGLKLDFSPDTTILYGKNAEGKTNMLEGVYMFAQGKSHRAQRDTELIKFGCAESELMLEYECGGRVNTLKMTISSDRRKCCYKNGVKLDKLSELIGNFRAVLFSPEHLSIIKDGPSCRRQFLDAAISQLRPVYMKTLQRYNVILMQRNALLRTAKSGGSTATLTQWSEQLAEYAAYIARIRYEYTERISKYASGIYSEMTEADRSASRTENKTGSRDKNESGYDETADGRLELHYHGTSRLGGDYSDAGHIKSVYLRQLTENTEREIMLGSTQYGVHKDDIDITLCGRDARLYSSQGQQRSIALTMKLAEGELSREETGEYPVFLLDDVLSELDPKRRAYIVSGIKNRQVIITSCDMSACRRFSGARKYLIRNGSYAGADGKSSAAKKSGNI